MALSDLIPTRRRGNLPRREADWTDLTSLQQEMNRMFDNFFSDFSLSLFREWEERQTRFSPSIDISETAERIKVTAELPGMEEKDISVTLEDEHLLLSGERKQETKEEGEDYCHREMSYGSFRRLIPLDAKIDADKVEASFKKGVLTITLPKLPSEKSRKGRLIEIKGE